MQVKRVVLVAASAAMLMTGCGKKGPLIYPDMLIAQPPQQLKVEQSGAVLRLSFNLPDKDRSGRKLEDVEAILLGRNGHVFDTVRKRHRVSENDVERALREADCEKEEMRYLFLEADGSLSVQKHRED